MTEFVAESLAAAVEQQRARASQRLQIAVGSARRKATSSIDRRRGEQYLGGKEFDFGVRFGRIDETGRVHLHLLDVGEAGADRLRHLDAVAGAVRTVRRWQTQ